MAPLNQEVLSGDGVIIDTLGGSLRLSILSGSSSESVLLDSSLSDGGLATLIVEWGEGWLLFISDVAEFVFELDGIPGLLEGEEEVWEG